MEIGTKPRFPFFLLNFATPYPQNPTCMNFFNLRRWLIGLFLLLGVILHVQIGWTPAWYLYLTAGILLATQILYGTVWQAFALMRKGKMLEAEILLNKIRKPEWLAPRPRAYYFFTKGILLLQKENLDEGRACLQRALEIGLKSDKEKALALLNLAHIAWRQRDFETARRYLDEAKACPVDDLLIKENLAKLETALSRVK
ncbi:MAG: hypothetical protein D6714_07350 [Bacteroidetes bacterium]|nr:MAG: hypothetical protein D6714_07350 [Bacteroidota bacterium]